MPDPAISQPERDALTAERALLDRKAQKRSIKPGFGDNVIAIRATIAEIDAKLQAPE